MEIRCFSSGGIRGEVLTKFSNAIGLRSPIRYDELVVVLQKEGQNYTVRLTVLARFESVVFLLESTALHTRIIQRYRFSPTSVSVEEGSITPYHLLSGKWNKPYPCNSYENLYRLLFTVIGQRPIFCDYTAYLLSISYDPIALIRVQAPTMEVSTDAPSEAGEEFLGNGQSVGQIELL